MERQTNYEELVQKCQNGEISKLEYVYSQAELIPDYKAFCEKFNVREDDDSAKLFIGYTEQMMMDNQ